ncbi:hypothetical protein H0H81_005679 [Sphagnurus paluster]|uniref:DNA damage-binding protein 1 n=1 Tax=Sphagnurus paluster TaxID=117069 RepID=A0A9P7FXR3_9AGAR|nr:hypothetical protein H0H81_005679 [Sphagnurus paluster]
MSTLDDNGLNVEDAEEMEKQVEAETQEDAIVHVSGGEDEEGGPQPAKKNRVRKEPVVLEREPGKSLLPFSRVQKIIKADKDIPIITKEATFLISLATEEFIKRISEAAKRVADRERRTTVQHKDIATVVRKADEFLFLEEIIPWMAADPPPRRKPQGLTSKTGEPTMLDQFVASSKQKEVEDFVGGDIVTNEDGTMGVVGGDLMHESNLLLYLGKPEPELVFLTYTTESGTGELVVKKQLSLYERSARLAEYFSDVLVHPSGRLAIVSCYTGKLKIITFKHGNHEQDFDVLVPELNVLGISFLPLEEDEYAIAIIHLDYQARIQLLARDIILEDLELSNIPSTALAPTAISSKIFPELLTLVPTLVSIPADNKGDDEDDEDAFLGGVLVVGGKKIVMYELADSRSQEKQRAKRSRLDSRKKSKNQIEVEKAEEKEMEREARTRNPQASVEWPWNEVLAICIIDPLVPRYLIGDEYGRLAMLSAENVKHGGLVLLPLGESPTLPIPAQIKTIAAVNFGRASTGKGKGRATDDDNNDRDPSKGVVVQSMGSFISIVETFKNIAPIVDAILVDIDHSGEQQIVTCSGSMNKGAIHIVRNGADFQELASVPGLTGVTNVWGVRDQFNDTNHNHILVSTVNASQLFRIEDAGNNTTLNYVQESGIIENSGFITDCPTLAFGNVTNRVIQPSGKASYENSSQVVQVTRKGAFLLQYDIHTGTYQRLAESSKLTGDREVMAASINPSQVLLALSGGTLVALTVENGQFRTFLEGTPGTLPEISSISCTPLDPKSQFTKYITVSYWGTDVVEVFVFSKKGFVSVSKSASLPALVCSVLLFNFGSDSDSKGHDHHPYVLAGLADGSMAYFAWKDKKLDDKKIISLGNTPVSLTPCFVEGKWAVFAAGSRSTLLTWEKKMVHSSPIMLKEIVAVSPLNTASFRSSMVLATPTGLFVGRVQDLDKMHIRSIPLGLDNPQKIAYNPTLKVFGVGFSLKEPQGIGKAELNRGTFKLLDDTSFSVLANFNCDTNEEVSSLATYSPSFDGKAMPLFCVGTYVYKNEEMEPTEGRLMIFSAYVPEAQSKTPALQLFPVAQKDVKGCVYAMTIIDDMIVVAVNSAVSVKSSAILFRLQKTEEAPIPTYVLEELSEWNHNYMLSSIASYGDRVITGDKLHSVSLLKIVNRKLQIIARDFGPIWPFAVEASDGEHIIATNDDQNLFTFALGRSLNRPVLERDGYFYLADFVTKFIQGSLNSSEAANNTALESKHIFFTSTGRIGVIVDVKDPELSLHLTALQRNLDGAITGVGSGGSHTRFRSPKKAHGHSEDAASFGFIDGDFIEQFLTYLTSPEDLEKIIAGQSEPERLTMPVEELKAVLESLQSMH